jgi:hypothetical protein
MKPMRFYLCVLLTLTAIVGVSPPAEAKSVIGYIERVMLPSINVTLAAKMDTGARHSSLSAQQITEFQRDGATWVRFVVVHGKGNGPTTVEALLFRTARIRLHEGDQQQRAVVKMVVCLGSLMKETEVNLIDRAGFNFPLLVGRSFLKGNFIVDPALRETLAPSCLLRE